MSLQVKVHHKQLARVLAQVTRAAGKKGIPVLETVRLSDNGHGVDVAATNTEIYISRRVPAVVTGRGIVCVNARRLTQILRLVPKEVDWITLEAADLPAMLCLHVTWGNSQYVLYGFPIDEFPTEPTYSVSDMAVIVQTDMFHTLLKRTAWAVGIDESKPWLTGIKLSVGGDRAEAVATDGVCIGWAGCHATITGGTVDSVTRIIPKAAIKELLTLLPTVTEATVEIVFVQQQIFVYAGDLAITSNTIEGQYPDVMRLIPAQWPYVLTAPRESLVGVIKRLAVLAHDGQVRIDVDPEEGLSVSAETPEVGQAIERMPEVTPHWGMTIGFNSKFLLKFLPLWSTQSILCEFSNPRNPARFRPVTPEDDYGAVIMPLITF